ncbi:hypothetical protein [Breznakia pachnodae]|uniref:DUF3021 family protein n=1 Tax=Breznakia pachnodae TaxID=265178 RepID=A0ABU0E2T7_9FIRM|nr:hypothetical protein [Breznakia pachnodae]MDQ0361217.1 hypothetical protein [Breznakia pachnodae]
MHSLRIIKNMLIIFSCSFVGMIAILMLLGIVIDNEMLLSLFIMSVLYSVMSIILFIESLSHTQMFIFQVIYVIMLNVIYIAMMKIRGLVFVGGYVYVINAIFSVILFILIKSIIYHYDKKTAEKLNKAFKKNKIKNQEEYKL